MLQLIRKLNIVLFLLYAVVLLVTGLTIPTFMGVMMCVLLAYYSYSDYKQTKGRS